MKQRIRNFCRTIRFKMLIILLAFLMVYVVTVSYFLYDTLQSTQSKILSPYQDMLDLYVEQLETSLEDIDSWMRNFSGDFDVNMMAIQDEKTDRYTLTKYQVRYDIHRNRPGYSTLDAVYVYDKRNESLMMIPDDCDHFEPLVYDFWNEGGWESEGWTVIGEEGKYALFRQYIVNNSVYIMVFVDLNKISEEIREIALGNHMDWNICTGEKVLCGTEQFSASKSIFSRSHTLEKSFRNIDMTFHFLVNIRELWRKNIYSVLFLTVSLLVLFVVGWTLAFYTIRRRTLMPLDLLIKGMQNFDGDEKPEKLVPSGRIEGEMAFAIDTFNDMVSQIWNDRILIYEEKLENQKLVIQNLHSQIDPHFFSNTLNLIYNLIAINRNDVAKKALILLSSYYRFMCNLDRKLISLKKEIDFICNYLEIMKLRFPEKLDIQLSFDETLGKLKIPPMLLQPLVENSIKYGFVNRSQLFHLTLSARTDGAAVLSVEDSGKGFPEEFRGTFDQNHTFEVPDNPESDNHVGLRNIYQRLLMYYGEDASLKIDWNGEWSRVEIKIRDWEKYAL